jgi:predicted nucleotide-binding protein
MNDRDLQSQLTDDQRQLLLLILNFFRENCSWPTYRWLNQFSFVQLNLDIADVFAAISPGHVLPEPVSWQSRPVTAETAVSLTLRGVASVGADHELKLFLDTLRYIGEEAAVFIPPPDGVQDLTITSDQVAEAIKRQIDDPGLPLVRELITNSVWEIWSGSGATADGHWQITVIPEKARVYRDVTSISALLQAREQREQQRHTWSAVAGSSKPAIQAEMPESTQPEELADTTENNTVFVVYGRNDPARVAMFEFLTSVGLEPLHWDKLLAATGEASPYVGEVLTAGLPMAQAVVVLLTPDDVACLQAAFQQSRDPTHETELTPQARPNVLFEAGMAFMSHPKSTVLVELGQLRPFSDLAGRHTVRLDDSLEARRSLVTRLQTAGCPVNLDGEHWKAAGDFSAALALASGDLEPAVHEAANKLPKTQFALVAETVSTEFGGGPVTLRVENAGPSDRFDATVIDIEPTQQVQPPWYVRWCNSTDQAQEILTGHSWRFELCRDEVSTEAGSRQARGWRFASPNAEWLVVPEGSDRVSGNLGVAILVTVRVTPLSNPREARENRVMLSLNDYARAVVWERNRIESSYFAAT